MQCFVVKKEEIEGKRLDCSYYLFDKIKYRWKSEPLKKLCFDIKNGSTPKGGKFEFEGIPYIRSQDFDLFNTEINQYITKEFHNSLSRSKIKPNDVLLAVVGATLGKVGYISSSIKEANINQNVAKLSIKDKQKILPKFLAIFLNSRLGQDQIIQNATITTQAYLNNQQLGSLEIPIPPPETQEQIVSIMDQAYKLKKENEEEVEKLLNSIDNYILDELGIKIPQIEEKKCFVVMANDVEGKRFDPYYHKPFFEHFFDNIEDTKYKTAKLEDIILDLKNGVEIRKYSKNKGFRYLRVSDLSKFGINDNNLRIVDIDRVPERVKLSCNDLLISRSGSLGLISTVNKNIIDSVISSHIFKVNLNTDYIVPAFLESFLRSQLGQFQFYRNNNGGIIPEISQTALKNTVVILPPLEIQNKIADEVKSRIEKAEALKKEAKTLLQKAKEKVEAIILGNKKEFKKEF